jgi:type IV secretion system protein VirD4
MSRRKPSLYRISKREADPAFALLSAAVALGMLSFIAMWVATEVVAWRFAFQPALGKPMAPHLYEPWAALGWLVEFARAPDPRVHQMLGSFWSTWMVGEAFAALMTIYVAVRSMRKSHSDLYGSAHWASEHEIRDARLLDKAGVYVGAWNDRFGRTLYLRHDGPEHVLAFAPTRTGKGVGLVLPTLLSWPHSVLVHDIKGENYALTAGWRASALRGRVLKFDPSNADGTSCRFNPLAQVRLGTPNEIKDVQNIVQILVDPDGTASQGAEAHWISTSSAFLLGAILHVLYSESSKSLAGVAAFLSDPSFENSRHIYDHMLNAAHDPYETHGWRNSLGQPTSTHPVVAMAAREMLNKDPREESSVFSTAMRFLTLFRDPIVAQATSASDFTVDDIVNGERPLSLYLVVPPSDIDRLKPLTRLVMNQILRGLTSEMTFDGGRSVPNYRHRLLLMIDEFPSLGRLEVMQTALAFMAGYGIKAYLIAQDVAQLSAAYGGATGHDETIMANCQVQIAFAPNKIETMELLSKLVGTTTVRSETRTYSGRRIGMRSQVIVNAQDTQRALLTPDEARRLPDDDQLIFVAGHAPIYAKKIRYFEDPTFAERAAIPAPEFVRLNEEREVTGHA